MFGEKDNLEILHKVDLFLNAVMCHLMMGTFWEMRRWTISSLCAYTNLDGTAAKIACLWISLIHRNIFLIIYAPPT